MIYDPPLPEGFASLKDYVNSFLPEQIRMWGFVRTMKSFQARTSVSISSLPSIHIDTLSALTAIALAHGMDPLQCPICDKHDHLDTPSIPLSQAATSQQRPSN